MSTHLSYVGVNKDLHRGSKLLSGESLSSSGIAGGYSVQKKGTSTFIDVPPSIQNHPLRFRNGKVWWGGKWIAHKRGKYLQFLSYGPPNYSYDLIFSSDLLEDEKAELVRFLLTLELWTKTPGEKFITAYEVWARSLIIGPSYADELSDLFDYGWRTEDPENYNFVFPARFLPRWEDTSDDLSLSKEKTFSDPEVLNEFRHVLSDLFEEIGEQIKNIELPSDQEIMIERSTSTSYVSTADKRIPQWEASLGCTKFNESELRCTRCTVPVFPGGIRDTVIADISANYSIRWLERSFRHILQYVPESAVTMRSYTFEKRMNSVVYKKGWHVLRDIKKCGITYNVRDIFPIVKEEISKIKPDHRWERLNIFNRMIIKDDDEEYIAQRGYGLGMANHLVTLCNIVIHRMARNSLAERLDNFKMSCICGNDDQDVVFYGITPESKEAAREYLESELDIHSALGNIVNAKKSTIKPYGLFYENYDREGWKDKEALVCYALSCAYLAPNIRVAKHYIYSQSERFTSKWAIDQLYQLAHFWGSEFFNVRDEMRIHYEIGGWLHTVSLGLKTTLVDIEMLDNLYDHKLIAYAYECCKKFISPPTMIHSKKEMVINHLYMGMSKKTNPKAQLYTLGEQDLRVYYRKLTTFQRRYASRLMYYKDNVRKLRKDSLSIIQDLLRRDPWYQIPDVAVEKQSEMMGEYEFDLRTEMSFHSDNMITDAINDNIVYDDTNAIWDPNISQTCNGRAIAVDWKDLLLASQFSNSGYLPILEYFLRFKCVPEVKPYLGRTRVYAPIRDKVHESLILSFFAKRKKKERKKKILEHHDFWGPDVAGEELDYTTFHELEEEYKSTLSPAPVEEIEPEMTIDNLLNQAADMGGLSTFYTGDHFTLEETERAESLDGDFSLGFGDEDY